MIDQFEYGEHLYLVVGLGVYQPAGLDPVWLVRLLPSPLR